MKKRDIRWPAIFRIGIFLLISVVVSLFFRNEKYYDNAKYYDRKEVSELFQSVNPDIYMVDHILELESKMPYSQLNALDIIELRDASSSDIEWQESYIWVLFYFSESEMLEDLKNPYLSDSDVIAYDKNIIIYDYAGNVGVLSDVCEELFPETYQKTS